MRHERREPFSHGLFATRLRDRASDDPRAQRADSLDLQLDQVARLQPAAGILRAEFEDAAGATVPVPRRSPGKSSASREACAISRGIE